jgi:hypothetical protein
MRILTIVLAAAFLSPACFGQKVSKYIQDHVTNRYNGQKTTIRNLIDIDGYYTLKEVYRVCFGPPKNRVCRDTTEINFLFYEDGTFLYNFYDVDADYPGNTLAYLERISKGNGAESFYNRFYWGIYQVIYQVQGDTIIAQYVFNAPNASNRDAWEDKFIAVDRKNIVKVSSEPRSLFKTTNAQKKMITNRVAKRQVLPATFKASPYIPLPNSWLKKEEWVHSR